MENGTQKKDINQQASVNLGDRRVLENYPEVKERIDDFMSQIRYLLWDEEAIKYFNTNPEFRKILKLTKKWSFEILQALELSDKILKKIQLEKEIKKYINKIKDNEGNFLRLELLKDCIRDFKKLAEQHPELEIKISEYEKNLTKLKNKNNQDGKVNKKVIKTLWDTKETFTIEEIKNMWYIYDVDEDTGNISFLMPETDKNNNIIIDEKNKRVRFKDEGTWIECFLHYK